MRLWTAEQVASVDLGDIDAVERREAAILETLPEDDQLFLMALVDKRREYGWKREDELNAYIRRSETVCRNCFRAGPLTASGNHPYDNAWASCRKGAPIAAPHPTDIEQYTSANQARWPTVRHSDTCGDFVLKPIPPEMQVKISGGSPVNWAFAEGQKE